jgi:hypothetical protein
MKARAASCGVSACIRSAPALTYPKHSLALAAAKVFAAVCMVLDRKLVPARREAVWFWTASWCLPVGRLKCTMTDHSWSCTFALAAAHSFACVLNTFAHCQICPVSPRYHVSSIATDTPPPPQCGFCQPVAVVTEPLHLLMACFPLVAEPWCHRAWFDSSVVAHTGALLR